MKEVASKILSVLFLITVSFNAYLPTYAATVITAQSLAKGSRPDGQKTSYTQEDFTLTSNPANGVTTLTRAEGKKFKLLSIDVDSPQTEQEKGKAVVFTVETADSKIIEKAFQLESNSGSQTFRLEELGAIISVSWSGVDQFRNIVVEAIPDQDEVPSTAGSGGGAAALASTATSTLGAALGAALAGKDSAVTGGSSSGGGQNENSAPIVNNSPATGRQNEDPDSPGNGGGSSSGPAQNGQSPPTSVPTPALLPGLIGIGIATLRKKVEQ